MAKGLDGHILAKGEFGRELLGALSESLPFLMAINAVEPDIEPDRFGSPIVQN